MCVFEIGKNLPTTAHKPRSCINDARAYQKRTDKFKRGMNGIKMRVYMFLNKEHPFIMNCTNEATDDTQNHNEEIIAVIEVANKMKRQNGSYAKNA